MLYQRNFDFDNNTYYVYACYFLQPLMIKQITDIGMVEKNMNAIIVGTVGLSICAFHI